MNTVELFAGTESFSKVASRLGYNTLTVDNNKDLNPDLCIDIMDLIPHNFMGNCFDNGMDSVDILWCSPPCTAFSVASIGHHWNKDHTPKTSHAIEGLQILTRNILIIKELLEINPDMIWFIENPRGKMRKVIDEIFKMYKITNYKRNTVTYCQYGDTRMKPTDIWTNLIEWQPRPICKNGASCHVSAPRGSRTGTQGLKNAKDRGVIPSALFEHIFKVIEQKSAPCLEQESNQESVRK